jgi:hypothetical protein
MSALAESSTSLAPRPAASLLGEAAGEHLPSSVSREQARAIINAATTQTQRLLDRHPLLPGLNGASRD